MRPRTWMAWLLASIVAPAGAVEITGDAPPDGLRGLLEVPALFGASSCAQRTGAKYPLYEAPSAQSPLLGTLEADPIERTLGGCGQDLRAPHVRKPGDMWSSPVPVREWRKGQSGLVITDARPGWIRILLGHGDAWMVQPPDAAVHDYGSIVMAQPVHLLHGWDGRVCSTPRLDDCRAMAMPANPAVRITRAQMVGPDLWFRVEFGIGGCEGPSMPGRDVLPGWIPGHGAAIGGGKRPLTLWLDPHGC